MRKLALPLLFLALSSCGGGSGSDPELGAGLGSGADSSGATNVVDEPDTAEGLGFDDFDLQILTDAATSRYSGITNAASIDRVSAGAFLQNVVYGFDKQSSASSATKFSNYALSVFHSSRWENPGRLEKVRTVECDGGGQRVLVETKAVDGRTVTPIDYQQCKQGSETWNGLIVLEPLSQGLYNEIQDHNLYFDNLNVTTASENYFLNGRQQHRYLTNCAGFSIFDELYSDPLNARQARYENFRVDYQIHIGCTEQSGSVTPDLPTSLEGRLWLSDYGHADISTPVQLSYSVDRKRELDYLPVVADAGGTIQISSTASGSRVKLDFHEIDRDTTPDPNPVISNPGIIASVAIIDVNEKILFDTSQQIAVALNGGLADIRDNDRDQILDGVEQAYGMNPNSAADAAQDADGDGISNLDEIINLSNPLERDDVGLSSDFQVTLSSFPLDLGRPLAVQIEPTIENLHSGFTVGETTLLLNLQGDGEWIEHRNDTGLYTCEINPKQISCELGEDYIDAVSTDNHPLHFTLLASDIDSVTVTAVLEEMPFELSTANNTDTLVFNKFGLNNNQVNSNAPLVINVPKEIPVVTEESTSGFPFSVEITNASENYANNVELQVNLPEGVTYTSGDSRCDSQAPYTEVICSPGFLSAGESALFDVNLQGTHNGSNLSSQVNWTASTEIGRLYGSNYTAHSTLIPVSGVEHIQSLIDDASAGNTIEIAAGRYAGRLDLKNKPLNLIGPSVGSAEFFANDDCSPLISGMAGGSTVSDLTFHTSGQAISFDSTVSGSTGRTNITGNDFQPSKFGTECQVAGVIKDLSSKRSFWRTLIVNDNLFTGFGYDTNGNETNTCLHLLDPITVHRTMIFRNHFLDNHCNTAVVVNTDYSLGIDTHWIEITNNTFDNMQNPIRLERGDHQGFVNIVNNMFLGTRDAISVSRLFSSPGFSSSGNPIENKILARWYKNLVFDIRAPIGALPSDHWNFVIFEEPLEFNPNLELQENGRYIPAPTSGIIDAGMELDSFIVENSILSSWYVEWVVDGNSDGNRVPDLGATEYQP